MNTSSKFEIPGMYESRLLVSDGLELEIQATESVPGTGQVLELEHKEFACDVVEAKASITDPVPDRVWDFKLSVENLLFGDLINTDNIIFRYGGEKFIATSRIEWEKLDKGAYISFSAKGFEDEQRK